MPSLDIHFCNGCTGCTLWRFSVYANPCLPPLPLDILSDTCRIVCTWFHRNVFATLRNNSWV